MESPSNIPYRTGVNLGNEAMLQVASRANVVGVKDCSADATQSFDLLRRRPLGFLVLTGEDSCYYGALAHGADFLPRHMSRRVPLPPYETD
jgi:4-hydroxy-tetrahydrodipicolinate synthase